MKRLYGIEIQRKQQVKLNGNSKRNGGNRLESNRCLQRASTGG